MIRLPHTSAVFVLFAHIVCQTYSVSSGSESISFDVNNEIDHTPKLEALLGSSTTDETQPVFPERADAVYFIIALHGGAKLWGRTLARTLLDMGVPFSNPQGPPLRPIILDLPPNGRYSSKVLTTLCELIDGVPLAGMIVVGEGQAAKMIALAGSSMKVPVLWAKGGVASFHGTFNELMSKSQAILQPSSREIFEALQSILLQTHWYSFYVLSDVKTTMLLEGAEGYTLKRKPLCATILQLPTNNDLIYRQLARISQTTRGVVILLCELHVARRILAEAQRMKMLNGHFVWLWADTTTSTEFYDPIQIPFEIFGSEADEEEELHFNNPLHNFSAGLEDDFYDATDIIQQSHIADLVERKMDFEFFDLKYKKNRTRTENKHRPYSIAKPDEISTDSKNLALSSKRDDLFKRNLGSKRNIYNENVNVSAVQNYSSNGDQNILIRTNNVAIDDSRNPNQINGATYKSTTSHVSEQNQKKSVHMDPSELVNLSDLKIKRAKNFMKYINVSSHVLFHHFQDFPVGLLALRPVTMKVDRHFIRSTVRLFASTWAKLEQEGDIVRKPSVVQDKQQIPNKSKYFFTKSKKYKRTVSSYKNSTGSDLNGMSSQIVGIEVNNNTIDHSNKNDNITNQNQGESDTAMKSPTQKAEKKSYRASKAKVVYSAAQSNMSSESNSSNKHAKPTIPLKLKRQQTWWSTKGYESRAHGNDRIHAKGGTPRYRNGCYGTISHTELKKAELFTRYLQEGVTRGLVGLPSMDSLVEKSLTAHYEILNLVPVTKRSVLQKEMHHEMPSNRIDNTNMTKWRRVGFISGRNVHLDTIVWPSGDIVVTGLSSKARSVFRIVVALAPPFVMETETGPNERCLRGVLCYQMYTSGRHNLSQIFNSIETLKRLKEVGQNMDIKEQSRMKRLYSTRCCFGLSMDLLQKVAQDLGFEFDLYIVKDGLFGRKIPSKENLPSPPKKLPEKKVELSKFDAQSGRSLKRGSKLSQILDIVPQTPDTYEHLEANQAKSVSHSKIQWSGIVGELVSGSADMSFAPLSVSKERARVIDYSIPFFHGGVSLLAAPQSNPDVPLLAFLLPFSPELWIAIFTSLNITAVAVAIYEWLSPFGLNPWGRQRSKNFSMSSALWVMWGLLCGHLVAFKAPKSWPNKFLINVWGGFSVIFVASYTANIAALIAGLFFHNEAGGYSGPLLKQRIGAPVATATEYYVQLNDKILWEHMKKYQLTNIQDGIERLKNGSIDLLMADSPILDYYRATDHGCSLQRVGDTYVDDSYAIGMNKGFPLKETISALISKYSSDGYLDILTEKWYGRLACFKLDRDIGQPKPLGVAAVAGVFLLLGLGMILGLLILIFEHLFYKYALPILRHQPKNTIWKSRNIMFFSQKLYRFINCVELVSPHHAAKELVHTIRQGQITSLFQKSIKREDEQRRRRKSKAQFFDMIQEIRRNMYLNRVELAECDTSLQTLTKNTGPGTSSTATITPVSKAKYSPKPGIFGIGKFKSNPSTLNVRRFSTDSIISARLDTIGRRLSRDMTNSPPDLNHRFETFGKLNDGDGKFDTYSGKETKEANTLNKFDTFSGKIENSEISEEKNPKLPKKTGKHNKRSPLKPELYVKSKKFTREEGRLIPISERVAHGLAPPFVETDASTALLRDKLHEELRLKYGSHEFNKNNRKPTAQKGAPHSQVDATNTINRQTKAPR
ncbi:uncharacterized protein LOC131691421 isoform X2 [Topomyia yanbarensis]|uniref:uncharacterized protein LOC131691421 isoform X2 n=1 Tax=Topomyia yanbarensis TaxID=2498891 RepID=UPI00273CA124|nr:uncharacterized protein LOC131691421 isoform X2 [Topomyia yanbarensis]